MSSPRNSPPNGFRDCAAWIAIHYGSVPTSSRMKAGSYLRRRVAYETFERTDLRQATFGMAGLCAALRRLVGRLGIFVKAGIGSGVPAATPDSIHRRDHTAVDIGVGATRIQS